MLVIFLKLFMFDMYKVPTISMEPTIKPDDYIDAPRNALHYRDLLKYEGYNVTFQCDSILLNGVYTKKYKFKGDYYFMLGDNLFKSRDSRYWGFVPRRNIIGKAVLVLFSLDPDEPWYKKFKWNRFLKRTE